METDHVLLGVLDLAEGKRLRILLEEVGVELWLQTNPENCSSNRCKPKVEAYFAREDLQRVRDFLAKEQERVFSGLDVNPALCQEVFDPEKETARCPACGTQFSTTMKECPDCGLVFMA